MSYKPVASSKMDSDATLLVSYGGPWGWNYLLFKRECNGVMKNTYFYALWRIGTKIKTPDKDGLSVRNVF